MTQPAQPGLQLLPSYHAYIYSAGNAAGSKYTTNRVVPSICCLKRGDTVPIFFTHCLTYGRRSYQRTRKAASVPWDGHKSTGPRLQQLPGGRHRVQ